MAAQRYLAAAAASAVAAIGLLWAWTFFVPLAYLDPEYPHWRAKLELLRRCDLGELAILGDFRAAANIIPALLPYKAINLAVGGGKSIEAHAALTRMLACPNPPRRVLISFDAGHFMKPDLFWERSVRFGLVGRAELNELIDASRDLDDWSVWDAHRNDMLPPAWRAALHVPRFPGVVVGNLQKAGGFLRWWNNVALLDAGIAARGHYYFGVEPGSSAVALDARLDRFEPAPVLDRYFDRILALLARHGIAAEFVAMPMNESTARQVRSAVRAGFAAYLAGYAARYPSFKFAGDPMPHWPDRFFGDAFSHLNPEGAALFSACLAHRPEGLACDQPRLQAAPPSTQNDAQYGWFNATGRAASAK